MGNRVSIQHKIVNDSRIPTLNIGNRQGYTGYIDFIDEREVLYPIVKGVDCKKRPFFVLRGISSDGQKFSRKHFFNDIQMILTYGCPLENILTR